jgi:hypothetical protein
MAAPVRKAQPTPPSPAEILEQIEALRAQEPELNQRMEEEAELSVTSGDETRYKAAVDAKVAHHQNITRLEAALAGAEARTKQEARAQQLAAQAAVRARVGKVLDERLATVAKIESAIGDLVKGWRELIELSDKAYAAYPNGPPPSGMALSNMELIQLVGAELYRQGATVPITGRPIVERLPPTIPGPKCPDYMLLLQPQKIVPLSTAIERANELARNVMEGKRNAA